MNVIMSFVIMSFIPNIKVQYLRLCPILCPTAIKLHHNRQQKRRARIAGSGAESQHDHKPSHSVANDLMTTDKGEVGGSSPPRPTISTRRTPEIPSLTILPISLGKSCRAKSLALSHCRAPRCNQTPCPLRLPGTTTASSPAPKRGANVSPSSVDS